jgi:hypothetical protein
VPSGARGWFVDRLVVVERKNHSCICVHAVVSHEAK